MFDLIHFYVRNKISMSSLHLFSSSSGNLYKILSFHIRRQLSKVASCYEHIGWDKTSTVVCLCVAVVHVCTPTIFLRSYVPVLQDAGQHCSFWCLYETWKFVGWLLVAVLKALAFNFDQITCSCFLLNSCLINSIPVSGRSKLWWQNVI